MNKLYDEINDHLLNDEKPSIYMNEILEEGKLDEYPFKMIGDLKDIPQNLEYHPEGNVWNHLMLVIDEGAKNRKYSDYKREFMMSLFLHDIGKTTTTKMRRGKWTSYDHDVVGENMSREFLKNFNENEEFINMVSAEVRYHMHSLFVTNNLPFADTDGMIKNTLLKELTLITLSDRMGRAEMDEEKIEETKEGIRKFVDMISEKYHIEKPEIQALQ